MGDQLDYRDGHEQADVAPVLVDRLRDGGARVVVRYPHDVRVRARNRFFITLGVMIAWGLIAWQAMHRPWSPVLRALLTAGWWPIAPSVVLIMAIMWWRAQRLYVLEADAKGLTLEVHGPTFRRRWRYARDWIKEIRVEKSLTGRPVAVTIATHATKLTRRLFDDLDERYLTIIAETVRDGLGMPAAAATEDPQH